jgi:hypothetical protein
MIDAPIIILCFDAGNRLSIHSLHLGTNETKSPVPLQRLRRSATIEDATPDPRARIEVNAMAFH